MGENMADLQIRDAHADERVAMQQLTVAAYTEYAAVLPVPVWEGYRANIIATIGSDESAARIVAVQNGRIVGSVLLYPAGAIRLQPNGEAHTLAAPEMRLLAVPPTERGHGVGAALLEECIRRARAAGVATLTLHTTDMMQTAMRMYEQRGFLRAPELDVQVPSGIIKGYRFSLQNEPAADS